MDRNFWKNIWVGIATLLLSLLIVWVFRNHYREIAQNIRVVRAADLLLLLGLGVICQLFEPTGCFTLVRS